VTRSRLILAAILLAAPAAAFDPALPPPPAAKRVPREVTLHGETRTDDYYWLKDKANPEVIKYLRAENAHTAAATKRLEPLRGRLYKEMVGRLKQTDRTAPYRDGGYWYYSRTEEGKQYPIHCRKKGATDAPEEVLLDGNELARGHKFFEFGPRRVSDDGNLLAYATDTTGFREYELSVKDLRTGRLVESRFVKAPEFEWAADNATLIYLSEDEAKRAHKVWRHAVGQRRATDALVYEERDELFWLELSRSRDRKYLFHTSVSYDATEQRYRPAADPAGGWAVILPREEKHEYRADHRLGEWVIRTNKGAPDFRVVACPVGRADPSGWRDLLPHSPGVMLEDVAAFTDFVVVAERERADPHLRVVDPKAFGSHRVAFGEPVYAVGLGENPAADARAVRFTFSSPLTPPSVYEYDPAAKARRLVKREEVLGGYDPGRYETGRVWAAAPDGTKVPVSLVHKKGVKRDGTAPCLLCGYGAYGLAVPMEFDPALVSLLDRGVVYALAHVRGGGDLGRRWYEDGRLRKKENTFADFIACADFLVREGYCARDRLVIQGQSAGGLLVGAVLNRRPDLCKAAVLEVPFVDALTSMSDETIPLTVQEFRQWGNPKDRGDYEYLRGYCPYTNLRRAAYPAILVTASLNDSQVLFHEPAKYVARLRALKTDRNPLLLKCNMDAGHGGASGRYDALKEQAFVQAFVLDQLGAAD
jgi:oligopeptidase B